MTTDSDQTSKSTVEALNQVVINGNRVGVMAAPLPPLPLDLIERRSQERARDAARKSTKPVKRPKSA